MFYPFLWSTKTLWRTFHSLPLSEFEWRNNFSGFTCFTFPNTASRWHLHSFIVIIQCIVIILIGDFHYHHHWHPSLGEINNISGSNFSLWFTFELLSCLSATYFAILSLANQYKFAIWDLSAFLPKTTNLKYDFYNGTIKKFYIKWQQLFAKLPTSVMRGIRGKYFRS